MINIFFSYSHADEGLRDELEKHLSILKWNGIIEAWHDRRILAGSEIDGEISMHMKNADIILLLISSDFMASAYCYDKEMNYALEKYGNNEVKVIPIILRPCGWEDSRLGKLLAIPTDGKPVVKFPTLDDAFVEIVNHIKKVVASIEKVDDQMTDKLPVMPIKNKIQDVRSSNLSIQKNFTDSDKDKFLDEAFVYIANYFEGSLKELKNRNPEIDYRFNRVDSQTFTSSLYFLGKIKSECMIYYGAGTFMSKSINYSRNVSSTKNSYNESLSVESDGNLIYLKSWTRAAFGGKNKLLTNEGGAEQLWAIFIEPLQTQ